MIQEAIYYSRMALGIREFIRHPAVADPMGALRFQMEHREEHFLDLARRIVFANPQHPYHEMFRIAGCTEQDLADEVARRGLEAALANLLDAGVYLTHDEFKGRTQIVRGGKEIPATPAAFLNPLVHGYIETRSSGSRGPAVSARHGTDLSVYRTVYQLLEKREFALAGRALALVRPVLPSALGIQNSLSANFVGQRAHKWFAPQNRLRESWHYRAMTGALVWFGRAHGAPLPLPESLPHNDFSPVARWLTEAKRRGRLGLVYSYVSAAVRVAAAAREAGLDISGTVFLAGGEPLTDAKRATIEAAGCGVVSRYFINEIGHIGSGCRQMRSGNRVHVFRDGVAVIGRKRRAPLSDVEVDSLLFTTLLPLTTRFLINAEMDDAGVIEPADCRCEFSAHGMNTAVRDIYSYGKLTGQGVTLMGSDALRVLEVALPARFGGSPGDYQLAEIDAAGQTELVLRVSQRVGSVSTSAVHDFFLSEIRRYYGGSLAARLWGNAAGLHVVVQEPAMTQGGKVLTLQTVSSKTGTQHAT
jgi:hypothetical protein